MTIESVASSVTEYNVSERGPTHRINSRERISPDRRDIPGRCSLRGAGIQIDCDSIRGIVECNSRIAVADDNVVAVHSLELIESAKIADIVGRAEIIGCDQLAKFVDRNEIIAGDFGLRRRRRGQKQRGRCRCGENVFHVNPLCDWLFVDAITLRDYPRLQAILLLGALIYVLVNLLVDLSYAIIDPRVRLS